MHDTLAHHGHSTASLAKPKMKRQSELDIALPAMDALSDELNRLAAINAELVGRLRGAAAEADEAAAAEPGTAEPDAALAAELMALREENAELHEKVEALEAALTSPGNGEWADRQREYEALLEEKSEVIRSLHLKLQELQEGARRAPGEPVPREEELVQLKHELEDQRRQLQEDEESLMNQMRQMELALSKDRAELARQRQEVQRLQSELNREAEQASRDHGLSERLNNLRRPAEPKKTHTDPSPAAEEKHPSGLFRRLFG